MQLPHFMQCRNSAEETSINTDCFRAPAAHHTLSLSSFGIVSSIVSNVAELLLMPTRGSLGINNVHIRWGHHWGWWPHHLLWLGAHGGAGNGQGGPEADVREGFWQGQGWSFGRIGHGKRQATDDDVFDRTVRDNGTITLQWEMKTPLLVS